MRDPVVTVDGESYELVAITAWLKQHGAVSPRTGHPLPSVDLLPNHILRFQADRYVKTPGF